MTIEVPLTQGQVAFVDDCDAWVLEHKWYAQRSKRAKSDDMFYAYRVKNRVVVALHREILGLEHGDGMLVDHINGNPLDNRRENLRVVTHKANSQNRKCHREGKCVGVSPRSHGVFEAQVSNQQGKMIYLGTFLSCEEAAVAVDNQHEDWFGSRPNGTTKGVANRVTQFTLAKKTTVPYVGVVKQTTSGNFLARITSDCRTRHLGTYDKAIDAATAVDNACELLGKGRPNGTKVRIVIPNAASPRYRNSKFTGISLLKSGTGKYQVSLRVGRKSKYFGKYTDELLAAVVADEAYGEYRGCRPNEDHYAEYIKEHYGYGI